MQTCPKCSHSNRDGVLVCERCRQPFNNSIAVATRQMRAIIDFGDNPISLGDPPPAPNAGKITFQLEEMGQSIVVENQNRIIIGRSNHHSVRQPDVDLAPYNGFTQGISSTHASIFRADDCLQISDLGSTNGTYLNRECLTPHMAYTLHNGDLINLGQMVIRIYF